MEVILPEIPEMEIYKDYLNQWVKNRQISDVNVLRVKCVNLESAEFCRIDNSPLEGIIFPSNGLLIMNRRYLKI